MTLAGVSGCNAQYSLTVSLADRFGQTATQGLVVTSVAPPQALPWL